MKKYLELIRVKHWIKNFLIFLPMVCSKTISLQTILVTFVGYLSFSFACSFIYVINDIKDIEKDKLHPRKKNRPLPSGLVSIKSAYVIAIVMLILSIVTNCLISNSILSTSLYILLSYIIINILYSCGLKNMAIIDVFLLSSGFILRVYYGGSLINIEVSNWLFLTIMCASLFLSLGKRKKELIVNKNTRVSLKEYNEKFLNSFQYIFLGCMFIFYSLWTVEQNNKYLVFTIPLLLCIFMKYSLLLEKEDEGDPTTILYSNKMLVLLCFVYVLTMGLFLVIL